MPNTTTRHVLGSSRKAVATVMNDMYPNMPYTYINSVEKWVLLTEYERLNIIFLDIDWADANRALATLVVKFFKDYIKSNPNQTDINMTVFDKFIAVEDMLRQPIAVEHRKTNTIYPRSHEFVLSVLPKRTEDLHITKVTIDTPTDNSEPPTMTLTVLLPMREV